MLLRVAKIEVPTLLYLKPCHNRPHNNTLHMHPSVETPLSLYPTTHISLSTLPIGPQVTPLDLRIGLSYLVPDVVASSISLVILLEHH